MYFNKLRCSYCSHLEWGRLDPSPSKALPVSLNSSQNSGLFFFLWGSNHYDHEIRKKTLLQPSNELIRQRILSELPAWILPQTSFQKRSPFSYIEFVLLLSLWFLIIRQAGSNQFFYFVMSSCLPGATISQLGWQNPQGATSGACSV